MMTYVWSSVVSCLHLHLHCSNVLVHSTSFSARSFDRALPLHARGHAPTARRHWERRYDTEQHRYPRAEVMARRCYIELYLEARAISTLPLHGLLQSVLSELPAGTLLPTISHEQQCP